jgi:hypothetical protein
MNTFYRCAAVLAMSIAAANVTAVELIGQINDINTKTGVLIVDDRTIIVSPGAQVVGINGKRLAGITALSANTWVSIDASIVDNQYRTKGISAISEAEAMKRRKAQEDDN